SSHRLVTTFVRVKKCTPSVPYAWLSPNNEFFQPPNEKYATGTGIGTLTPTIPTSTSFWNRRAAPPSLVKIAVPLPYGLEFTRSSAASYDGTRTTDSTGPKISSV